MPVKNKTKIKPIKKAPSRAARSHKKKVTAKPKPIPKEATVQAPSEEELSPRFKKTSRGVLIAQSFQTPTHVDQYRLSIAENFKSAGSYFKGRNTPRVAPSAKLTKAICHLIRIGSHPVTAARALGIPSTHFWNWFELGASDTEKGIQSPFSAFCTALDAATAQDEILDISLISQRVNNWQALAWKLSRKNRGRWGDRMEEGMSDDSRPAPKAAETKEFSANKVGKIAAILESVGALEGPENPMTKINVKKPKDRKKYIEVESVPVGKDQPKATPPASEYPEYDTYES